MCSSTCKKSCGLFAQLENRDQTEEYPKCMIDILWLVLVVVVVMLMLMSWDESHLCAYKHTTAILIDGDGDVGGGGDSGDDVCYIVGMSLLSTR